MLGIQSLMASRGKGAWIAGAVWSSSMRVPAGTESGRGLPQSKTLRERLTRAGYGDPQATHSNDFLSADFGSVRTSMRWSRVASIPPRRIAKPSR